MLPVAVLLPLHGECTVGVTPAALMGFQGANDHPGLLLSGLGLELATQVGHQSGQVVAQFVEPLVGGGGDHEDLQPHALEFRADKLRQLPGFGQVGLVENDHPGALLDRDNTQGQLQLIRVLGQLVLQSVVVADRVPVRLQGGAVNHMGDDLGSFNVAKELQTQTLALRGTGYQPGNVGHGEPLIPGLDHTQIGNQGGEGVIGDFGLCRAHGCHQAGLAGTGEAHQGHIRYRLEFQDQVPVLTRFTQEGESGCAPGLIGQ